jgi:hypothetical protein
MGRTCSTYGEEQRCTQVFNGLTRGKETIVLKGFFFSRSGLEAGTGLIWLRIGTGGGRL